MSAVFPDCRSVREHLDLETRHQFHEERQPQLSDRERRRLIKAERELLTLQIIAEHLDLSDIAMTRIADALEAIRLALQVKRRKYGMPAVEEATA